MENIYVSKDTTKTNVNEVVDGILDNGEKIEGSFLSWIPARPYVTNFTPIEIKGDKHFSSYGNAYKCIVTNLRIILIIFEGKEWKVNGIRIIEYDDIYKLRIDRIDNIVMVFKNGICNEFSVLYLQDDDKYILAAVDAIEYIISRIGFNKIKGAIVGDYNYFLAKWVSAIVIMAVIIQVVIRFGVKF